MSNALDDLPHQDSCRFWRHGDICDCGAATPSAPKTAGDTREALAAMLRDDIGAVEGNPRLTFVRLTLEEAMELLAALTVAHGRGPNFVGKLSPFSIAAARAIEAAHGIGAAPAAPAQEPAPLTAEKVRASIESAISVAGKFEAPAQEPQQPRQQVAMPPGWVPLRIEYEPGYPEDVAFGPQRMMDRLKKWLDKFFAMRIAESSPAPAVQPTEAVAELVDALAEIAWSNDSKWQMDRALAALAKHGQPRGGSNV